MKAGTAILRRYANKDIVITLGIFLEISGGGGKSGFPKIEGVGTTKVIQLM